MAYNDRGGFSGGENRGGNRFGGGGHGGHSGSRRPPMEMHQATCAECGKSCEVPFRPSGDKPVFCSNCFKGKNNDSRDRSGGDRNDSRGPRRSYGDRDYSERPPVEMHEAVCSDCGKDCEVPFKPSGDKPIYCDKCFGKNKEIKSARHSGGGNEKLDEKLTMINIKLDRILKVLDAGAADKTVQKKGGQNNEVKDVKEVKTPEPPTPEKPIVKKAKKKAKVKKAKE
ncbi:MAG: CxxC-x17-CxxC domain-containing protein [Patescibacteria group bacterium]